MPDPLLGSRVGPYRIVMLLGEGGMGAVYLAERDDKQFHKQVAIKVLKRGADGHDALRRFQLEREVLAALDHPSIVRLLDAGVTATGIPCVIMDYVEGVTIDKYCATAKPSLAERLRLFVEICSAVHYAHQRLVVHCDIKPANILVASDGRPKLLDFGIGKLLRGDETQVRGTGSESAGPLTPDHASPEQLLGLPVTTSTDIYALGLTLYEMLVGQAAYTATSDVELVYKVTQTPPEPPSKVADDPKLRGDLDAITLKAMAKDPAERYASVAELSDDVNRHLATQPIRILSGSPRYRIRKFVERNRVGVIAASLGLVLLVAALVGAVWAGVIARQQRARAEHRFNEVRQLVNVLLFDFYDAASKIPGATPLQEHMVKRSVEYLDSLAKEATENAPLAVDVIDAYVKFGDIQGNPYQPNLGDAKAAVVSYQKALDVANRLLKTHPGDKQLERGAARAHQEMADVLMILGRSKEGLAHVRKATDTFEKIAKEEPNNVQAVIELASCIEGMGDQLGHPGLMSMGDEQGALASYRKALENWSASARLDPSNARAKRARATVSMKIADVEDHRGNSAEALKMYREALASMEGVPPERNARRLTAMLERKLGTALAAASDSAGAEQHLRRSLAEFENLSAADPVNTQARFDVANIWQSLSLFYDDAGDFHRSIESYGKVADILEGLSRADPSNVRYPTQLSGVLIHIGELLAKSGQIAEANRQTRRGLDLMRRLGDDPNASAGQLDRAASQFMNCLPESLRDPHQALLYARRAVKLTKGAEPSYLETLSDAQAAAGVSHEEIMDTVKNALALNPPEALRKRLEAKLSTPEF